MRRVQGRDLGPQRGDLRLDGVGFRLHAGLLVGRSQVAVLVLRGGKERLRAIIIGRRDRVELMVVTAGAADGQTQERGTDAVDHFRQHLLPADFRIQVAAGLVDRPAPVQPSGNQGVGVGLRQLVARHLFD